MMMIQRANTAFFRRLWWIVCTIMMISSTTITTQTHAFMSPGELNVIDQFLEIFINLGGERLLEQIEQGQEINRNDHAELDAFFDLPCLLGTIRFNKDTIFGGVTDPRCFESIRVCLEQDDEINDCQSSNQVIEFTDQLDATGNEFRYMNNQSSMMSSNFHGVFWLSYELWWSSIMSFAPTKDGGTLSTGYFSESDKKENINYRIRVPGDRNWAFETSFSGNPSPFDTIYEFRVTEGSIAAPTRLQIFFSFATPVFPLFRFHLRECFDWLFKYEMSLLEGEDKSEYDNSVVWKRTSHGLFFPGGNNYFVIQIIDGNGDRIEPAYQNWLKNQRNTDASGFEPNVNYFLSLSEREGCL